MTKTILFAAAFALFSFAGLNATPAQACDTCGCAGAHAHTDGEAAHKPCEKTLGEKKSCCGSCDDGKPCEKKLHGKKPCEKTLSNAGVSNHINTAPLSAAPTQSYNKKGSLILKSNQSFTSRASAGYN